jgi:predicted nuclease of predicted toxin-antitoxin system
VRFLVDAQLPPALARWLAAAGHQAEHVADVGLAHASDPIVWQHAAETQAVIVTKDEDFALRAQLRPSGPPVAWIRYGNVRRAELLRRFSTVWPSVADALARGEGLIRGRLPGNFREGGLASSDSDLRSFVRLVTCRSVSAAV